MSKSKLLISVVVVVLILAGVVYWLSSNSSDNMAISNPASVYCVDELGGELEIVDTPQGQMGFCRLPDGRVCEEWEMFRTGACVSLGDNSQATIPTDAEAERVGFNFILDFIKIAPPDPDLEAQMRVYNSLSSSTKAEVSMETISSDMAAFVGVQDVPDQGASVEDLQKDSLTKVALIVGLNYTGSGRVFRAVELIVENGEWKVENVRMLEQWP